MNIDECFQLGYVIRKHGLGGAVNIKLDVDDPQEYSKLESLFIEINKKLVPFFVDDLQIKNDTAVIKFEDVDSADEADELKGKALYLPLDNLPELEPGQFYFHEIIGYTVSEAENGVDLGKVTNIYTALQDLMAFDYQGKEVLVPIIDEIILNVNHENQTVIVNLPEGLIDIYTADDEN